MLNPHTALAHRSVCDFPASREARQEMDPVLSGGGRGTQPPCYALVAAALGEDSIMRPFCSLSSHIAFLTLLCQQGAWQDSCPGMNWIRTHKLQSVSISKAIYVIEDEWQRQCLMCRSSKKGRGMCCKKPPSLAFLQPFPPLPLPTIKRGGVLIES